MKAWRAPGSFCTPHSFSERSSCHSGPVGLNSASITRQAQFNSCFYEHLSSGMISEKEKKDGLGFNQAHLCNETDGYTMALASFLCR